MRFLEIKTFFLSDLFYIMSGVAVLYSLLWHCQQDCLLNMQICFGHCFTLKAYSGHLLSWHKKGLQILVPVYLTGLIYITPMLLHPGQAVPSELSQNSSNDMEVVTHLSPILSPSWNQWQTFLKNSLVIILPAQKHPRIQVQKKIHNQTLP